MTTEREYQEWQRRNKVYRHKKSARNKHLIKNKKFAWLSPVLTVALTIGAIVAYNPNLFQRINLGELLKFQISTIRSLSEELVTEINEPIIIIGDDAQVFESDFTSIDQQAQKIVYSGNSVGELAQLLNQYATTDLEKARLIYSWITHNISYDVEALNNLFNNNIYPDVSTHNVLINRSTICSGYANLYQQLAEKMGLKSIVILGYAKGGNYAVGEDNEVNHGWNGVKIDGKWYLVDATWGAGIINENQFQPEFNSYYFAIKPDQFIYSHFPENSQWQLLNQPLARNQFDELVEVSDSLFKNNIELISPQNKNINTEGNVNLTLKAPDNIVAIAKIESDKFNLSDNYTFVNKHNGYIKIKASFPEKGNYKLNVFAKPEDDNNYYPLIASYDINASQGGSQFPTIYKHFSEHNGYLESPLNSQLPSNQNVYFKIRIDNATEVKVVNQSINNWTDLTRYGNLFSGQVNVEEGKIVVFAKFKGDSRYWALLEYN